MNIDNSSNVEREKSGKDTTNTLATVLIIDGAYAKIGTKEVDGMAQLDYLKLRNFLEEKVGSQFRECWFFDQEAIPQRSSYQTLSALYTSLKRAPPDGPHFQVKLYPMKQKKSNCPRCAFNFHQLVQKGVDNGIATKILSLAYEQVGERFVLLAGDGDFYDTLDKVKNDLRKEVWVVGYKKSLSADLQQLASQVIWLDDVWNLICKTPNVSRSANHNSVNYINSQANEITEARADTIQDETIRDNTNSNEEQGDKEVNTQENTESENFIPLCTESTRNSDTRRVTVINTRPPESKYHRRYPDRYRDRDQRSRSNPRSRRQKNYHNSTVKSSHHPREHMSSRYTGNHSLSTKYSGSKRRRQDNNDIDYKNSSRWIPQVSSPRSDETISKNLSTSTERSLLAVYCSPVSEASLVAGSNEVGSATAPIVLPSDSDSGGE